MGVLLEGSFPLTQLHEPRSGPGLGAGAEAARWVHREQGDGQPDSVEEPRGLVHRHAERGLDGDPGPRRVTVTLGARIVLETGQGLSALLEDELAGHLLAQLEP